MEQTNQKPLQKEKKPRSPGRTAGLIAGIAVGVLAAAYIAVCAAAAAGGTTLRGTRVLGVDVGGLTAQQVRDKWQREGDAACRKETIDLTLEDYSVVLTLTQLEGVETVMITVDGEMLAYRDHQRLTAEDAWVLAEAS